MQPGDLFPFALTKTSKQISMSILGNRNSCSIEEHMDTWWIHSVTLWLCVCSAAAWLREEDSGTLQVGIHQKWGAPKEKLPGWSSQRS